LTPLIDADPNARALKRARNQLDLAMADLASSDDEEAMLHMRRAARAIRFAIRRNQIDRAAGEGFMQQIADAARAVAEIAIAAAIARAGGAPAPVPPEILDAQTAVTRGDHHYSLGRWLWAIRKYLEALEEAEDYQP